MVHPLLTVVFDLFLIGAAAAVIATMISEARQSHRLAVGAPRSRRSRPVPLATRRNGTTRARRVA